VRSGNPRGEAKEEMQPEIRSTCTEYLYGVLDVNSIAGRLNERQTRRLTSRREEWRRRQRRSRKDAKRENENDEGDREEEEEDEVEETRNRYLTSGYFAME
jgi:hypothetical protein